METLSNLVVAAGQEGDHAGEEDRNVEDDIGLGDFLQCRRVQTVQNAMKHGASSHDADCLPVCWDITLEVVIHRHGSKEQLCASVFSGGSSRDLTQQIQPAG